MPCRNGVCWRQGQRPPAAARINIPQPQPAAPGTAQLSPSNVVLPQIEQMGRQPPTNLPVNQGANMPPVQQQAQLPIRQPRQVEIQQPKNLWQRFKEFFTGSPEVLTQLSNLTPEQENLFEKQLLPMLMQRMQPQNQFNFEPIRQQALERFQTETAPSIAERFTSMGPGAQRSSAFKGATLGASAALERSLAALQSQIGLQREEGLHRLLSLALSPGLAHNVYNPATTGISGGLAQGGGQLLGGIGQGIGGLMGAYALQQALPYILGTAVAL